MPRLLRRTAAWLLPYNARVITGCLLAGIIAAGYAAEHLRLHADVLSAFAPQRPWRQHEAAIVNAFPHLQDAVRITVTAGTTDRARALARSIHYRLPPTLFRAVYYPAAWPFFRRQILMYRDAAELETLAAQLAAAYPWLARLRPNSGLADLLTLPLNNDPVGKLLAREMAHTIQAHAEGRRHPLSWQSLLFATGDESPYREHVLAWPRMDFERFLPAQEAVEYLRSLQQELGEQMYLDGKVIRDHQARSGLAQDLPRALSAVAVLTLLALGLSLPSLYVTGTAALTLGCGFTLAASWIAATHDALHAAAVLAVPVYAGVGAGWVARYAHSLRLARARGQPPVAACAQAGTLLIPPALTTLTVSFVLALSPWATLAQPAQLAGGALLVLLLLCLSLLPALLLAGGTSILTSPPAAPRWLAMARSGLPSKALIAGLAAVTLLATHPVARSQGAPRAPLPEPLAAQADNPKAARELAARLQRIPGIQATRTLFDLVPEEQPRKAASLAWLGRLYAGIARNSGRTARDLAREPDPEQTLQRLIPAVQAKPVRAALEQAHARLQALPNVTARRQALAALATDLSEGLPAVLQTLAEAVRGGSFGLQDLPVDERVRWVTPDAHYLVLAWPAADADLAPLVRAVQRQAADITGTLVLHHEFERAAWQALWPALLLACVAFALVALPWRQRVRIPRSLLPTVAAVLLTLGIWAIAGVSCLATAALPLVFIAGAAATGRACRHTETFSNLTMTACAGTLILVPHANLADMGWILAVGTGLYTLGTRQRGHRRRQVQP